jgi:hypothetical protein
MASPFCCCDTSRKTPLRIKSTDYKKKWPSADVPNEACMTWPSADVPNEACMTGSDC